MSLISFFSALFGIGVFAGTGLTIAMFLVKQYARHCGDWIVFGLLKELQATCFNLTLILLLCWLLMKGIELVVGGM